MTAGQPFGDSAEGTASSYLGMATSTKSAPSKKASPSKPKGESLQPASGSFAGFSKQGLQFLAMEFAKSGEYEQAIAEYRALLAQDENYAAAYYHGGQALEKLGQVEEAKQLYEAGLVVTKRKGDSHTHGEIEAALSLLPV